MTVFSQTVQMAVTQALNNCRPSSDSLQEVSVSEEAVVFVRQESPDDAIIVHLLPSGEHDVFKLGHPTTAARRDVSVVCQSIAREWRRVRQPTMAPMFAHYDCWR